MSFRRTSFGASFISAACPPTKPEGSHYMSKIVDLVSLASIVPPLNHEVSGGFNAMVDGKQVRVRAVLERTVVIEIGRASCRERVLSSV